MTNYELALELLDRGMADKHHTFNDTGYIVINLGGAYGGYISPNDKNVEITKHNEHIGYGVINMDKMVVHDTANRFELPIEKYVNCSVKCVDERPVIVNRRRGR